jgi:hypothetical protein
LRAVWRLETNAAILGGVVQDFVQVIFKAASGVSTPVALGAFAVGVFGFIVATVLRQKLIPAIQKKVASEHLRLIVQIVFVLALVGIGFGFAAFVLPMKEVVEHPAVSLPLVAMVLVFLIVVMFRIVPQIPRKEVQAMPKTDVIVSGMNIVAKGPKAAKAKPPTETNLTDEDRRVLNELRNQGSIECGRELESIVDEFRYRWGKATTRPDGRDPGELLEELYLNLKKLWEKFGGRIERHGKCRNQLSDLRNDAEALKLTHEIDERILSTVDKLIKRMEVLSKEFPIEAANSREARDAQLSRQTPEPPPGMPTPGQVCGHELRRIHETFFPKWVAFRKAANMHGAYRMVDTVTPLIRDFITNHNRLVPHNARWERLQEFGQHWTEFSADDPSDDDFWRRGDHLFAEMLEVAQAFQLAH